MIYAKHHFRTDVVAFNPQRQEVLQAGCGDINVTSEDNFEAWVKNSGFIPCSREEFETVYKAEISRINEFIKEA